MKNIFKYSFVAVCYLQSLLCHALNINTVPGGDSRTYYKIGGSSPQFIPPTRDLTTFTLGFGLGLTGLECGRFDPRVSLKENFDDLKQGIDDAVDAMQNAAQSAIASLPGLILMKANADLYQLFSEGLHRYNLKFELATKDCQNLREEGESGMNPFADWVNVSAANTWKVGAGTSGVNIEDVKKSVETDPGATPITWIDGQQKAGKNVGPIELLSDVVTAGGNLLSQRNPTDLTPFAANKSISEVFKTPQDMRDWVGDVLGEVYISTCKNCQKGAKPGRGLGAQVEVESWRKIFLLDPLVKGNKELSRENLSEVSVPGLVITKQVIESIRQAPPDEQNTWKNRIGTELGSMTVVQKAFHVKKALEAGKKEPNVYAIQIAKDQIDSTIAELDKELATLKYEKDYKDEFASQTIGTLLDEAYYNQQAGRYIKTPLPNDAKPIEEGYVKP